MKTIANILTPLAAAIFFGACMISGLGLLVTLMASVGFGEGLPWAYFLRLNLPTLSVALPMAGMILFAIICFANAGKTARAIKPAVVESAKLLSISEEEKKEEALPKAA
jgi:hypothetical protein